MIDTVITYFSGTLGKVELLGTIFSLICVYLATKHNIWTWFWGVLGVLCFGYLFAEYKLYSDAGLQILFYLPLQFVGYYVWKKSAADSGTKLITKSMTYHSWVMLLTIMITLATINGYLMFKYTEAALPYYDALTTWMSVFAQILMIKKYWESWVLWVSMDVIAIWVYQEKELYVTSGLYAIFLVLASYGLYKWYNNYKEQT